MSGKQVKLKQVNRLRLSRGHDGIWRVRSPDPPHKVLFENTDQQIAYRWAHRCRRFAEKEPRWAEYELEYLSDNYGILPAEEIARRLCRTINALKIISFRKLKINQRSNIYTARAVATELGIG